MKEREKKKGIVLRYFFFCPIPQTSVFQFRIKTMT